MTWQPPWQPPTFDLLTLSPTANPTIWDPELDPLTVGRLPDFAYQTSLYAYPGNCWHPCTVYHPADAQELSVLQISLNGAPNIFLQPEAGGWGEVARFAGLDAQGHTIISCNTISILPGQACDGRGFELPDGTMVLGGDELKTVMVFGLAAPTHVQTAFVPEPGTPSLFCVSAILALLWIRARRRRPQ